MLDHRIHEDAVLAETVIEMRARCGAGGTDKADHFSLRDARSGAHPLGETRKMQVPASAIVALSSIQFPISMPGEVPLSE